MKKRFKTVTMAIALTMFLMTFMNRTLGSSETILQVTPSIYTANEANMEFNVNVTVTNVDNLFAWQFKLRYDPSLILEDCIINEKFFAPTKNGENYIFVGGTLLQGETTLNGNVVLASVYFKITAPGEYSFDLFETALLTDSGESIPHQVVDGAPNTFHDIALLGLTSDPSGWVPVPQGKPVYIEVTVENNGNFNETFTLYVYADRDVSVLFDELIAAQTTVSLEPGKILKVSLVWDTTDAPYGSYYISAKADITDDNMGNNFVKAASFVGGICHRWDSPAVDYSSLLIAIASSATLVVSLAAVVISVFKALAIIRMPRFMRKIKI